MTKEEAEQLIQRLDGKLVQTTEDLRLYSQADPWYMTGTTLPEKHNFFILKSYTKQKSGIYIQVWFKILCKPRIYYTGFDYGDYFSTTLKEV